MLELAPGGTVLTSVPVRMRENTLFGDTGRTGDNAPHGDKNKNGMIYFD